MKVVTEFDTLLQNLILLKNLQLLSKNIMSENIVQQIFEKKKQYHLKNAHISFESKIRQIIELQRIDQEFNKTRKLPRSKYMRIWKIDTE